jgi:diaminohydroxyphosphoribosylaminopyrimidine deaminase/5-amino-6-(5-phosphoribosylamino)uracil reductase
MNDSDYMAMALELAARGAGRVSPNPMVGAVVVKDGRVVGQGYHQAVGGPHAEVNALSDAGRDAENATLYVTLEPCNHHGRTPPCTEAVLRAGIRRVVVAMADPNPDVQGGGNAFLRSRGVQVMCGVCVREAVRLNEGFITFVRSKRPFVLLKTAATLDGRIATRSGDARWVTGPQARQHVHHLRHAMDAILVGVGTVQADDPQLTTRLERGEGVDPIRLVLDTNARMSPQARMLRQPSAAPTYVVCGPHARQDAMDALRARGARILQVGLKDDRIDLNALMQMLGQMSVTSLLIEGGSQVAGAALAADIVDKVNFFYAPKIVGGDDGVPMLRGPGATLMKDATSIHEVTVNRVGDDILVEGYLHPLNSIDFEA